MRYYRTRSAAAGYGAWWCGSRPRKYAWWFPLFLKTEQSDILENVWVVLDTTRQGIHLFFLRMSEFIATRQSIFETLRIVGLVKVHDRPVMSRDVFHVG